MDRYYQILDKDTSTISPLWKALHIICLVIVIISGFITAGTFGKAVEYFGDNCFLNAQIVFRNTTNYADLPGSNEPNISVDMLTGDHSTKFLPNHLRPIVFRHTKWGHMGSCNFCQFTPVLSMVFGIIWCIFFLMCSKGGAGYITDRVYQPWRIVYPAIIFAAVTTLILLISTIRMNTGIIVFCSQFEFMFNTKRCTSEIDQYTLSFMSTQHAFTSFLKTALVCSYICLMGWLLHLCVLALRIICIVDFQMICITVTVVNNTEELQQKVVNPDDASDLASTLKQAGYNDTGAGVSVAAATKLMIGRYLKSARLSRNFDSAKDVSCKNKVSPIGSNRKMLDAIVEDSAEDDDSRKVMFAEDSDRTIIDETQQNDSEWDEGASTSFERATEYKKTMSDISVQTRPSALIDYLIRTQH